MSLVEQYHRAHLERRKRLYSPRIPLAAKIIPFEPEIPPEELVWPSLDMVAETESSPPADPDAGDPISVTQVSVRQIQTVVAKYFDITVLDLHSHRKTARITYPRQVAMYLSRTLTTRSLPEIGLRFGGRDHTTVLWAVRKITAKLNLDDVAADVSALERLLKRPA